MADPIKWRSKILLAKIETVYGTDPAPAAGDGILATNVEIKPMEGNDVSRDLEYAYLGAQPQIPTAVRTTLTYSVELAPSGTAGTVPAWGVLARACGLAEVIVPATSVTYSPISTAMESVTHYFWIGGTRQVITGCRGTAQISVNAQGIPVIRYTFTGLWSQPTEAARVTPALTGFKKPEVATNANTPTFTVNAVPMVLRNFGLNFGNDVQPRLLIGREEILIVDRAEEITAQVEGVHLSTFDPFALANAQTSVAVNLVHGTAAGKITTIAAPTCQLKRLDGYANDQDTLEWPLSLIPLPASGNDQFSITLT